MLGLEVLPFAGVVGKVVELDRRQALAASDPGLGALQPPESGQRISFQAPWRIANEPLIEWCTVASRTGPAAVPSRSGRMLTLSSPASAGKLGADDRRDRSPSGRSGRSCRRRSSPPSPGRAIGR